MLDRSTMEKTYSLIKNSEIINIIMCDTESSFLDDLTNSNEIDGYVEMNETNFFGVFDPPTIGWKYHNNKFIPASWIMINNEYVPPYPAPDDGCPYEWFENSQEKWVKMSEFPSWIYDPETKTAKSPIPYPQDGKEYVWNEDTISWVEINQ